MNFYKESKSREKRCFFFFFFGGGGGGDGDGEGGTGVRKDVGKWGGGSKNVKLQT